MGYYCPFLSGFRPSGGGIIESLSSVGTLPITSYDQLSFDISGGEFPDRADADYLPRYELDLTRLQPTDTEPIMEYIDCIESQCMMWNDELHICNLTKHGASQEYFEEVLGSPADKDYYGGDPLIKVASSDESPILKVLGSENDLIDPYTNETLLPLAQSIGGLLPYLRTVLGNEIQKSMMDEDKSIFEMLTESSLQEYFNTVIGTEDDKDIHPPLVGVTRQFVELMEYLINVVGHHSDKNEDEEKIIHLTKILPYFRNVIGEEEDLDMEKSLVSYLIKVIGREEESSLSLMAYMEHMHHQHLHFLPHDYDVFDKTLFGETGGVGSIPKASVLVNEFMGNEDLDGNDLIYGVHFKIGDDYSKPVILNGLEQHPLWPDPSHAVSWGGYLQSLRDG